MRALFDQVDAFQFSMFFFMFFFFCWGNWLSTRLHLLTLPVLLATGAMSLLCWGAILNIGWSIERPFGAVAGLSMTTSFLALFRLSERVAPPALLRAGVYLGVMSLEIYVMHHMASGIMRIGLARVGVETLWLHAVAGLFAGIAVPLVMAWLFGALGLSQGLALQRRKRPSLPTTPPAAVS